MKRYDKYPDKYVTILNIQVILVFEHMKAYEKMPRFYWEEDPEHHQCKTGLLHENIWLFANNSS